MRPRHSFFFFFFPHLMDKGFTPLEKCMNAPGWSFSPEVRGVMAAKQAHPGFFQLTCASPTAKMRLKGGLNKSAAPLAPAISELLWGTSCRSQHGCYSWSSCHLHGWCLLVRRGRFLYAEQRQYEAHLHYRLIPSALKPSLDV
uniref:Uncharacterized protein n=1 Tax=Calidris pygmaea TaxID=425635 RepID=A0A8C3PKX3_9CHAR